MPSRAIAHSRLCTEISIALSSRGWTVFKTECVRGLLVNTHARACSHGYKPALRGISIGDEGQTDLLAVRPAAGRADILFIETKTGAGFLEPAQVAFRDAVVRKGWRHIEARSVEQVLAVADAVGGEVAS